MPAFFHKGKKWRVTQNILNGNILSFQRSNKMRFSANFKMFSEFFVWKAERYGYTMTFFLINFENWPLCSLTKNFGTVEPLLHFLEKRAPISGAVSDTCLYHLWWKIAILPGTQNMQREDYRILLSRTRTCIETTSTTTILKTRKFSESAITFLN